MAFTFTRVVICLKIRTFVVSATTFHENRRLFSKLWFAWKFVPLWYQQQPLSNFALLARSCDLLENSYLCGISNNYHPHHSLLESVVICLKIRTFVVSATTSPSLFSSEMSLWFAWKFVPLWYQQQPLSCISCFCWCCDLLENSYLCGISNNWSWIIYWLAQSYKIVAQK